MGHQGGRGERAGARWAHLNSGPGPGPLSGAPVCEDEEEGEEGGRKGRRKGGGERREKWRRERER